MFLGWTIVIFGFGVTAALYAPSIAKRLRVTATTPDTFAQGALTTILGDLTQEITAGSLITLPGSATIYAPKAPPTAVPALAGSSGTSGLENLLKRSAYATPFFAGANYNISDFPPSNRAANVSSAASSSNGLAVLPLRWNKPLLLPKANAASDTDVTPVGAFASPDWVLVARDGSNPTTWTANLQTSDSNAASVVGRYA